jgi:hypothetical protein
MPHAQKTAGFALLNFLGGFFEKILLNILDVLWADMVKSEKNNFVCVCVYYECVQTF